MFSKDSRYARLDDLSVLDSLGRTLVTKIIRRPPVVDGTFEHSTDAGDRLDHLAYKYYKQSTRWWRIADANPKFSNPLDMLGQDSVVTYQFRIDDATTPAPFPWLQIIGPVQALRGVVSATPVQRVTELNTAEETIGADTLMVTRERHERVLEVTFNLEVTRVSDISDVLVASEFIFFEPELVGRIGKPIIIPTNSLRSR